MDTTEHPAIYDGDGDRLMRQQHEDMENRILLVPDSLPLKVPDRTPRIRIMWGQHLLEDLLSGRYRSLVCAVNAQDNSHGIIAQLAALLSTSQWDRHSITDYARQFALPGDKPRVLKYDMDVVEVLAILRPASQEHLTVGGLASAFKLIAEMIQRRPGRMPSASVSFLGARANALLDDDGREPSFESVLRTMYEAGYGGDVYPAPSLWHAGDTNVFARYPFPPSLDRLREGGF